MNSSDPVRAALRGEELTMDLIKKQGLPLLRSEAVTKHINKIPGASLAMPFVENYINKLEDKGQASTEQTITETTSTRSTKVGNIFPLIKPR